MASSPVPSDPRDLSSVTASLPSSREAPPATRIGPSTYVLGTDLVERARLVRNAGTFAPEARDLLDHIGVQPGWRAIDIGCGPLGILDLLSERVGATGEVVGLEREPQLLEVARSVLAERAIGNVQLVNEDGVASGLPRDSFDLAHERLVLNVCPQPERMVAEMVELVRPGGVVALQDVVTSSSFLYPPHPAFDQLRALFTACYERRGLDEDIGARLPTLLREAGLVDITVEAHTKVSFPSAGVQAAAILSLFAGIRAEAIGAGITTDEEFAVLLETLERHLNDPGTLGVRPILFQAWGRKPAG
jgi:SAM-dependent methyltransferase